MSLLNQSPDEMELLLLASLEKFSNATLAITQETESPVVIIVVVVCAVGLSVICLCVFRCVQQLISNIFFIFYNFFIGGKYLFCLADLYNWRTVSHFILRVLYAFVGQIPPWVFNFTARQFREYGQLFRDRRRCPESIGVRRNYPSFRA